MEISKKDMDWINTLLRLFGSYKAILLDIGHDPLEVAFMNEDRAERILKADYK